jgi:L-2-hydroxyglutarate oxidase LhgO
MLRRTLAASYHRIQTSSLHSSSSPDFDVAIIGAGAIGLAIARRLASASQRVVLLESGSAIGQQTSSRNSEVIHGGIYYPTGSLKTDLCVQGKQKLYDFCLNHNIPHKRLGKIIAATSDSQLPALEALYKKAHANNVIDVVMLSKQEVKKLEPSLNCVAALFSPSTGIIDSHSYMAELQRQFESHPGCITVLHSKVIGGTVTDPSKDLNNNNNDIKGLKTLQIDSQGQVTALTTTAIVNASGLYATKVAASLQGLNHAAIPDQYYAKGCYFKLSGMKSPFNHLIYPMPDRELGGLGVHLTLDLGGSAKFGPDVEWLPMSSSASRNNEDSNDNDEFQFDYKVDSKRGDLFYPAIRKYWPSLPDGSLVPDYSGIRAKVSEAGRSAGDFIILGREELGVEGVVSLHGMESPGLTASLAIADKVNDMLEM